MNVFRVQFESDSTEVFFTTKKFAEEYIRDMCKSDDIPQDEWDLYFYLDEIETLR